ncbi:anti-sigma factor [Wenxinia marina]|uniref:Regulator of SigK n=1 Tax=Wenxinia marina DSM 24838 TaxID=1123501 RepID=A0A0D0PE10_9RHOB|nr:anti-sigma factor [Wenxinia marina]KIQ69651.1 hypothetical protein Wenmar_02015 [Wenxinia marina DSM 24838]GGL60047.1 hypothetical protein GCM10011392_13220 [Wenxinia marina]
MTMTDGGYGDDDRALAGEYVLGLLSAAEAAAVRTRLAADALFAREVRTWREAFAELDAETAEVAPPPRVLAAIEERLFPGAPASSSSRPSRWRWLSGVAFAASVAVALFFTVQPPGLPPPVLLASVASEDQALQLRVGILGDLSAMHVILDEGSAPPGRVLELWAIAEGQPPVSLGVIEERDFFIPDYPREFAAAGLTLAVSEEPPGGSPTGQPTGEVLALGTLAPV